MRAVVGFALASCALLAGAVTSAVVDAPKAQAVSWSEYQQKVNTNEYLKNKLAGVSSELAQQIEDLNNLNNTEIPAAQESLTQAQQSAEQAKSQAQATGERLEAAKKDKQALEEKIKQSGIDYDDAKDAVAQMARKGFHGSDASDVMNLVTKSSNTQEFVGKMQSDAAVSRSEANAASDAAGSMNTSMNRKDRLEAIEKQIATLKKQADEEAASAQKAAEDAQTKQDQLKALRDQGAQARASLEAQKGSLSSQSAREAADIATMQSQIDSWSIQNASAGSYNPGSGGAQQSGGGAAPSVGGGGGGGGGGAFGMNYAVPGSCPSGSGFCYGHPTGNSVGGSAYPPRQCTLWAYLRRSQLSLPVGSYMGNGADWANTARGLGYVVNNTPHVGAAMVFAQGQRVGSWNADPQYGHVAVVERVNGDGSVLISEGGTGFATFPASEIVYNAGAYQYVHY